MIQRFLITAVTVWLFQSHLHAATSRLKPGERPPSEIGKNHPPGTTVTGSASQELSRRIPSGDYLKPAEIDWRLRPDAWESSKHQENVSWTTQVTSGHSVHEEAKVAVFVGVPSEPETFRKVFKREMGDHVEEIERVSKRTSDPTLTRVAEVSKANRFDLPEIKSQISACRDNGKNMFILVCHSIFNDEGGLKSPSRSIPLSDETSLTDSEFHRLCLGSQVQGFLITCHSPDLKIQRLITIDEAMKIVVDGISKVVSTSANGATISQVQDSLMNSARTLREVIAASISVGIGQAFDELQIIISTSSGEMVVHSIKPRQQPIDSTGTGSGGHGGGTFLAGLLLGSVVWSVIFFVFSLLANAIEPAKQSGTEGFVSEIVGSVVGLVVGVGMFAMPVVIGSWLDYGWSMFGAFVGSWVGIGVGSKLFAIVAVSLKDSTPQTANTPTGTPSPRGSLTIVKSKPKGPSPVPKRKNKRHRR